MAGDGGGSRSDWRPRLLLSAVALVLLALFVAQNFLPVEVRLVFATVETRLAWALLIAGGLGFAAGLLLPRVRR